MAKKTPALPAPSQGHLHLGLYLHLSFSYEDTDNLILTWLHLWKHCFQISHSQVLGVSTSMYLSRRHSWPIKPVQRAAVCYFGSSTVEGTGKGWKSTSQEIKVTNSNACRGQAGTRKGCGLCHSLESPGPQGTGVLAPAKGKDCLAPATVALWDWSPGRSGLMLGQESLFVCEISQFFKTWATNFFP